jgi:hypothetical protein
MNGLGAAYAKAMRYAEAEAMLVEAQAGLKRPELQSSSNARNWLGYSLRQLVQLYKDWGKPEQAAAWQKKLDEFNQDVK